MGRRAWRNELSYLVPITPAIIDFTITDCYLPILKHVLDFKIAVYTIRHKASPSVVKSMQGKSERGFRRFEVTASDVDILLGCIDLFEAGPYVRGLEHECTQLRRSMKRLRRKADSGISIRTGGS